MNVRPILFSGPMVRAILDGTKTQTRRIVHPDIIVPKDEPEYILYRCPYGRPGDRLWVRETARLIETVDGLGWVSGMGKNNRARFRYEADGQESGWLPYPSRLALLEEGNCVANGCYKEAHRINLEIKDVRVERLQEISEADAKAEGIEREHSWDGQPGFGYDMGMWYKLYGGHSMTSDPVESFRTLWDSINAARGHGWDQNDWVWVVEFARI